MLTVVRLCHTLATITVFMKFELKSLSQNSLVFEFGCLTYAERLSTRSDDGQLPARRWSAKKQNPHLVKDVGRL